MKGYDLQIITRIQWWGWPITSRIILENILTCVQLGNPLSILVLFNHVAKVHMQWGTEKQSLPIYNSSCWCICMSLQAGLCEDENPGSPPTGLETRACSGAQAGIGFTSARWIHAIPPLASGYKWWQLHTRSTNAMAEFPIHDKETKSWDKKCRT